MRVLAQQQSDEALRPGFFDNQVTEQFLIPVGAWADQAVDWIAVRLDWLLSIVEWPFENLINLVVDDILEPLPWVVVAIAFFVIGTLTRNVRVGAFAVGALSLCGILGNNYWLETARTIGYVGVAVLLCVIVGIPLGVACGRTDSTWRVVRPLLDGMQVIPSFVYMLPFIFFFGVGVVPATMVTMTFALPPLVRLTNLGIRQVPGDVVEASRAYGAPEWRVLLDVQLPLARPAIATGINQTLLLAVSMLGIAALMGAGGLGRVLFQAITTQDIPKGMASGLAFFLVAVVLDRISQPEDTDSASLIRRVRLAWAHRRDPEKLLDAGEGAGADASEGTFARVTANERLPMGIAAAGGVLAVVSVFLTWTSGAGLFSAYGRRIDEDLAQQSFSGLEASGGSWFGYLALGLGVLVVGAVLMTLAAPGRGPRWLTADGALISSLALLVMMACYVLAAPADAAASYSAGAGVYVALAGGLLASAGSFWWVSLAPHSPLHPLTARIGWGKVVLAGVAVVILGMAAISGWSFDQRKDVVRDAEVERQIAELEAEAEANPTQSGVISAQISALLAAQSEKKLIITDGVSGKGPGLGIWTLAAGLAGLIAAVPAAGAFGRDEHLRWRWSTVTAGIGAGVGCVTIGWIATQVRSADDSYITGVGAFIALIGGVVLAATAASVLKEFRRSKVYADAETSFTH